jgi:hypothetical protein
MDIVRIDELNFPVTIIGCGGIGSPTTLALAKMGVQDIKLVDFDTIENHNLPNQIYQLRHVGMPKVEALGQIIQAFTGITPTLHNSKVDTIDRLEGVVISGVDSMASRYDIWKMVRYKPQVSLYIDARMGAEVTRIYSIQPVNPVDVVVYEATLRPDEEIEELPCTARAIIYNVFMIASLIANQVKKFARGEPINKEVIFDLATLMMVLS